MKYAEGVRVAVAFYVTAYEKNWCENERKQKRVKYGTSDISVAKHQKPAYKYQPIKSIKLAETSERHLFACTDVPTPHILHSAHVHKHHDVLCTLIPILTLTYRLSFRRFLSLWTCVEKLVNSSRWCAPANTHAPTPILVMTYNTHINYRLQYLVQTTFARHTLSFTISCNNTCSTQNHLNIWCGVFPQQFISILHLKHHQKVSGKCTWHRCWFIISNTNDVLSIINDFNSDENIHRNWQLWRIFLSSFCETF